MNGMKSIFATMALLFILTLFFASMGHHFFAGNDPLHFGTYALSIFTFFEMSTFDNWSEIYYLNFDGCDSYPDEYQGNNNPNVNLSEPIYTYWGTFERPNCAHPESQPAAATVLFVTYTLLAGYVIVNMCLAAVAIGINEKLVSLKSLTLYGELEDDGNDGKPTRQVSLGKATKLLGNKNEAKIITGMLTKIWEGRDGVLKHAEAELKRFRSGDMSDLSAQSVALDVEFLIHHRTYEILMTLWIIGDALAQVVQDTNGASSAVTKVHAVFHAGFVVDCLLRALSHVDKPREFFKDKWNTFDLLVTVALFVPLCASDLWVVQFIGSLRIFRLARILKTLSTVFIDLEIILNSVSSSFVCLLYVFGLVVVFFLYYGFWGVLLFKDSDPYNFRNIAYAMRTLLEVMTQDNWTDVMRKNMYGCSQYGFFTGLPKYDDTCHLSNTAGKGVGWWSAIYFVPFMVISSMVLMSLLVGVIITSLELLREGKQDEAAIWGKVANVKRKYELDSATIDLMLLLFEKMDHNNNGMLTFDELRPILDLLQISEIKQFEFYMKVDVDKSGQIDFSEFCEMITLVGMSQNATHKVIKREPSKAKLEVSKMFRWGTSARIPPSPVPGDAKTSKNGREKSPSPSQVDDTGGMEEAEQLADVISKQSPPIKRSKTLARNSSEMTGEVTPFVSTRDLDREDADDTRASTEREDKDEERAKGASTDAKHSSPGIPSLAMTAIDKQQGRFTLHNVSFSIPVPVDSFPDLKCEDYVSDDSMRGHTQSVGAEADLDSSIDHIAAMKVTSKPQAGTVRVSPRGTSAWGSSNSPDIEASNAVSMPTAGANTNNKEVGLCGSGGSEGQQDSGLGPVFVPKSMKQVFPSAPAHFKIEFDGNAALGSIAEDFGATTPTLPRRSPRL